MKKGGKKKQAARSNQLGKGLNDDSEDEEVIESESSSDEEEETNSSSEESIDSDSDNPSDKEQEDQAEKQIQIYFTSDVANEKYQMEDTIYTIPASFRRIDLSRMVKKLLDIKENVKNSENVIER
ncbi:hypothetical protein AK88_04523 [Plasmodium fragile]|uniref:NLE domain-containing protein n=1 Tax=Plasmodium fragile TaxID=5857 RepID=A0A0D9QJB2_PLAFR|nr:uncharacterized protein AK88_04523 [Plasmodium fragile]KJP85816.1 hypothetical protein AK88_04523 [Plasmodium fragile]